MNEAIDNDLSVSQLEALQELLERVEIAQRRSSRTKAIVLLGPDVDLEGTYEDLKTEVAEVLAQSRGEYINFQDHLDTLLAESGITYDPSRLGATALTNYLYSICEKSNSSFLVVDKLHLTLRLLRPRSSTEHSEQVLLVRALRTVMFSKPVVLVVPLFPEDASWITQEAITELLGSADKWVYLEGSEIDRAFLRERVPEYGRPQDDGGY